MRTVKEPITIDVIKKQSEINQGSDNFEAILKQLQKNEQISQEILKAVVFIKSHYFWRSIAYGLKVLLLVLVILFGIVSWRSILDSVTNYSSSSASAKALNLINSQ